MIFLSFFSHVVKTHTLPRPQLSPQFATCCVKMKSRFFLFSKNYLSSSIATSRSRYAIKNSNNGPNLVSKTVGVLAAGVFAYSTQKWYFDLQDSQDELEEKLVVVKNKLQLVYIPLYDNRLRLRKIFDDEIQDNIEKSTYENLLFEGGQFSEKQKAELKKDWENIKSRYRLNKQIGLGCEKQNEKIVKEWRKFILKKVLPVNQEATEIILSKQDLILDNGEFPEETQFFLNSDKERTEIIEKWDEGISFDREQTGVQLTHVEKVIQKKERVFVKMLHDEYQKLRNEQRQLNEDIENTDVLGNYGQQVFFHFLDRAFDVLKFAKDLPIW